MRPGQLQPNDFELAILKRIMRQEPSLPPLPVQLSMLSREFTGVGSYTNFQCDQPDGAPKRQIGLNALIRIPGVPSGLGALLFCRGDEPVCLEIYTFGDEHWDGVFEGFSIE